MAFSVQTSGKVKKCIFSFTFKIQNILIADLVHSQVFSGVNVVLIQIFNYNNMRSDIKKDVFR